MTYQLSDNPSFRERVGGAVGDTVSDIQEGRNAGAARSVCSKAAV